MDFSRTYSQSLTTNPRQAFPSTFMIIAFPFNSGKRISHLLLPDPHVLYKNR